MYNDDVGKRIRPPGKVSTKKLLDLAEKYRDEQKKAHEKLVKKLERSL